jgi:hypothetical protein
MILKKTGIKAIYSEQEDGENITVNNSNQKKDDKN